MKAEDIALPKTSVFSFFLKVSLITLSSIIMNEKKKEPAVFHMVVFS